VSNKIVVLNLTAHHQDCGDGSNYVQFFNSEEDLIEYAKREWEWEDDQIQSMLDGDDPYENGAVSDAQIKLSVSDDGTITLAEPFGSSSDG
jgi:hypothetical protein